MSALPCPLATPITLLGFSYLGHGVSLHGWSSKAQPLLLTLDAGCVLTTALPDLQCGMARLGPPAPTQPPLLRCGVAPLRRRPCPWTRRSSSQPPPLTSDAGLLSAVPAPSQPGTLGRCPDLGRGVTPLGHCPSGTGSSRLLPLTSDVG